MLIFDLHIKNPVINIKQLIPIFPQAPNKNIITDLKLIGLAYNNYTTPEFTT